MSETISSAISLDLTIEKAKLFKGRKKRKNNFFV
jgi:hypothetical protein